MKNHINIFVALLLSIFVLSACEKDDEMLTDDHELEITIMEPTEGQTFVIGAEVHVHAKAIWNETLHGYDIIARYGGHEHVLKHSHEHEKELDIHYHWETDFAEATSVELVIKVYQSHHGDEQEKTITISFE